MTRAISWRKPPNSSRPKAALLRMGAIGAVTGGAATFGAAATAPPAARRLEAARGSNGAAAAVGGDAVVDALA